MDVTMTEKKVKGTILIDMVRMIRGNRDKDWDKYLTPEDWEIINGRVLPSSWYPFESYQRCGLAVFQNIAEGDLDLARLRGKIRGKELFEDVYRNVLESGDPQTALGTFVKMYKNLFNFSTITYEKAGDKHALLKHDYDPDDPGNVPYCYILMGHLEQLVEMTGGKNVKIELSTKQWEGDPVTTFDIRWD